MFLGCPDCSLITIGNIIEPQTVLSKEAFSNSTLFMLGVMMIVLGSMIYFIVTAIKAHTK
jgi:heme/copper-type cytochrome/quinol oxidase subunit 2